MVIIAVRALEVVLLKTAYPMTVDCAEPLPLMLATGATPAVKAPEDVASTAGEFEEAVHWSVAAQLVAVTANVPVIEVKYPPVAGVAPIKKPAPLAVCCDEGVTENAQLDED